MLNHVIQFGYGVTRFFLLINEIFRFTTYSPYKPQDFFNMEAKIVDYIARKEIKELGQFLDTVDLQEVRVFI